MANKFESPPTTFGFGRRDFLKTAAAGAVLPILGGLPRVAVAQDVVNLTCWAWAPGTDLMAKKFEEKFPNIKVKVENVGQGDPHYVKLRNAITAGTGLPDVAQVEFNSISSFKALNVLADMGAAGANAVKDRFIDWTWKAVSDGDKVYAIPWDSGPMGLLYRTDIFDEHKLAVPETWADFAETSKKLAKDKPGSYLTNFGIDAGWIGAVLWQAGARPFHVDGTNIRIDINGPIAKKWADYWQALLDAKAVNTMPMWTSEWFAAFDDGTNVTWITAAWGPAVMSGSMKTSVGKWRAAAIPQWDKGGKASSNWGGSTFAAFTSSPHLKEATEFAMFMGGDPDSGKYWNQKQFFFPVLKDLVADNELMGTKYDFYGGQAVNEIFATAANQVDPSFEFAPFQDYVNSQLQDELNAAVGGKGTLSEALDRVQATVVAYATDQGYTVT